MNELVKQEICNVLGQGAKRALGLAATWVQQSWQSGSNYDKVGLVVSGCFAVGLCVGGFAVTNSLWQKAGSDGNLLNPLRNSLDAVV